MRFAPLIGALIATTWYSTSGAQTCSVKYYGLDSGQTKVLQPGQSVGSYLMEQRNGDVSAILSSSLEFQGRTGERTFAFVAKSDTKIYAVGRAPKQDADSKPLSVYWDGSTTPMKLAGYTFYLSVSNGETTVTIIDHPRAGQCPVSSAVGTHGPNELISQLSLDLAALQREGFDPSRPAIDGCAPAAGDAKTINCTGRSPVASEQACRAAAMSAIIGMAQAASQNSLGSVYTLECAKHRLVVHYSSSGAVQVEETLLGSGAVVFSKQFMY